MNNKKEIELNILSTQPKCFRVFSYIVVFFCLLVSVLLQVLDCWAKVKRSGSAAAGCSVLVTHPKVGNSL